MTTAAERQRRRRERQKQGLKVLSVPCDLGAVADWLSELGMLEPWDSEDPAKVADALARYLWESSHA